MTNSIFVSTAIPYVNSAPHVGFATELVLADALARYHRQRHDDVFFLTGSDENSLKNVQAAEVESVSTAELVHKNAGLFRALKDPLNLSYNDFLRTSADARHQPAVEKLWRACRANGDIYKKSYGGLYCVGCEQFYQKGDLLEGLCPEHRRPPEWVEEENYFFRLSRYAHELEGLITSGRLRVQPEPYRAELLAFICSGVDDFSISRSRTRAHGWGVPVPDDEEQVVYVWFDALANYISALGYGTEQSSFKKYWLDAADRCHVLGKGVTRFHGVYWPAILLSAGVPPPTRLCVHSYVTVEGKKIGKSLGNVIDPNVLVSEYGVDALRYFLLRHVRTHTDGDFSASRLQTAINGELADQLGNLLRRIVSLVQRHSGGILRPQNTEGTELPDRASRLEHDLAEAFDSFQPHLGLDAIWDCFRAINQYLSDQAPWTVARAQDQQSRVQRILYTAGEALRISTGRLYPFLPETSQAVLEQLGHKKHPIDLSLQWATAQPCSPVQKGDLLFKKRT